MSANTPKESTPRFAGFDRPEQNWFRVPDSWTDITAGITSLAELKVIEYVLKHTWGYQEYHITKRITIDEFMHGRRKKDGSRLDKGTGLSKPSVVAGLKSAVEHGYLEQEADGSDKARIKKYYRLRMLDPDPDQDSPQPLRAPREGREETHDAQEVLRSFTPGVKNLNTGVNLFNSSCKDSLQRSEEDNIERHLQKDTYKNNNNSDDSEQNDVVVALLNHHISKRVAEKLASTHDPDYVREKIHYLEFLQQERPQAIQKPAAWLRKAIEEDYTAPDGFISAAERAEQAEAEKRRREADLEALRRQREAIDVSRRAQEAAHTAWRKKLHRTYGTRPEDLEVWQEILQELRYGMGLADFSWIADAEMLQITADQVRIGVTQLSKWRELQHPARQTTVRRAIRQVTGRAYEVEFVLLDDEDGVREAA